MKDKHSTVVTFSCSRNLTSTHAPSPKYRMFLELIKIFCTFTEPKFSSPPVSHKLKHFRSNHRNWRVILILPYFIHLATHAASSSEVLRPKFCTHFSSPSWVLHAPPSSSPSYWSPLKLMFCRSPSSCNFLRCPYFFFLVCPNILLSVLFFLHFNYHVNQLDTGGRCLFLNPLFLWQ
jgi:hypothetical protein